jgi:hypothetical protein
MMQQLLDASAMSLAAIELYMQNNDRQMLAVSRNVGAITDRLEVIGRQLADVATRFAAVEARVCDDPSYIAGGQPAASPPITATSGGGEASGDASRGGHGEQSMLLKRLRRGYLTQLDEDGNVHAVNR